MKKKVIVNRSLLEETRHFEYSYPVYTDFASLRDYEHFAFAFHWHSELEFTVVLEGEMEYCIGERSFLARAGTGMLVNANVLHMARSAGGGNCRYLVVIIDPMLVYGNEDSAVKRYVDAVLHTPELSGVLFSGEIPWQKEIMDLLQNVGTLNTEKPPCYELEVQSSFCKLWAILYRNTVETLPEHAKPLQIPAAVAHIKGALDFIHRNYREKITLQDIARSGNISAGECCRIFKRTLHQSPIQYLMEYRVRQSMPLLLREGLNITEISDAVGFSSSSYFAEVFHSHTHMTPREYRASRRKEREGNAVHP